MKRNKEYNPTLGELTTEIYYDINKKSKSIPEKIKKVRTISKIIGSELKDLVNISTPKDFAIGFGKGFAYTSTFFWIFPTSLIKIGNIGSPKDSRILGGIIGAFGGTSASIYAAHMMDNANVSPGKIFASYFVTNAASGIYEYVRSVKNKLYDKHAMEEWKKSFGERNKNEKQ